jgi:hypothetical protein
MYITSGRRGALAHAQSVDQLFYRGPIERVHGPLEAFWYSAGHARNLTFDLCHGRSHDPARPYPKLLACRPPSADSENTDK